MKTREITTTAIEFENGDQLIASQYNKNIVLCKSNWTASGKELMEYTDAEMIEIYNYKK